MYDLSQLPIERSNRCKWSFDEPVFAGSLHQLSDPVFMIDIHDDVEVTCANEGDSLTEFWSSIKNMI